MEARPVDGGLWRLAGFELRPVCRGVSLLPTEGDDEGGDLRCVAGGVCWLKESPKKRLLREGVRR